MSVDFVGALDKRWIQVESCFCKNYVRVENQQIKLKNWLNIISWNKLVSIFTSSIYESAFPTSGHNQTNYIEVYFELIWILFKLKIRQHYLENPQFNIITENLRMYLEFYICLSQRWPIFLIGPNIGREITKQSICQELERDLFVFYNDTETRFWHGLKLYLVSRCIL